MAAQNTLSILETIKQKMQKLDGNNKPKPAAIEPEVKTSQTLPSSSNQATNLTANAAPVDAQVQKQSGDNLDFDFDVDDENSFTNNSPANNKLEEKKPEPLQSAHEELSDDEFEKLMNMDHDLDDEDEDDVQIEEQTLEHPALENLDQSLPNVNNQALEFQKDDFDFNNEKDLNNLVNDASNNGAAGQKKPITFDDLDNIDLEELEGNVNKAPAEPVVKKESIFFKAQVAMNKMPEANIVSNVNNFDDLEGDKFEDEMMAPPSNESGLQSNYVDNNLRQSVFDIKPKTTNNYDSQSNFDYSMQKQQDVNQPKSFDQNLTNNNQFAQYNSVNDQALAYQDQFQKRAILNEDTIRQTSDSVKKLIDAKNMVAGIKGFSQSPVLAEIAIQLLEPKLEKWLNENLAYIVEDIVREEIKNIIPKE